MEKTQMSSLSSSNYANYTNGFFAGEKEGNSSNSFNSMKKK